MNQEERDRIARQVREFRAYVRRRYARDAKIRHDWLSSLRSALNHIDPRTARAPN